MARLTALLMPLLLVPVIGCNQASGDTEVTVGEARSADGLAIRYDVRGYGEPTLILVHGWTNTRGIWGEHPTTLSRTHRVVTLDLAGHGESGATRADWTMDAFGEDVAAVVEELDLERVVLIGYSMGAAVVLEAAERIPERVEGVLFVDALHDPEMTPTVAQFDAIEPRFRAGWGDTAFVRAFAFRPDTPDSLVQFVTAMMPAQPREHWFPTARAMYEWAGTQLKPTLQHIDAPIAAINATNAPTNVEALRRYAPSFLLDTIQGVGHAGILLRRVDDFDARLLALIGRFAEGQD